MRQIILVREAFGPRLERRTPAESPWSGELFREKIFVEALRAGSVHLDFSGMDMLGGSALDEVFSGMVLYHPELAANIERDVSYSVDSRYFQPLLDAIPLHIREARKEAEVRKSAHALASSSSPPPAAVRPMLPPA